MEKVSRPGKGYSNPRLDITDLAGVRVITYYVEDVDQVQAVLDTEFEIDWGRSLDKRDQLDPDQFGYLSRHFVARLKEPRASLPEWSPFRELTAEFQVRTALQHAWAAVSHKVEYKSEIEVPFELRRGLHRLSALFELADSQFSLFRDTARRVDAAVLETVAGGDFERALDWTGLVSYTAEAPAYAEVRAKAEALGARFKDDDVASIDRDRRDLLRVAVAGGMQTVADLDAWMQSVRDDNDSKLLRVVFETTEDDVPPESVVVTFDDFLSQALNVQYPQADATAAEIWSSVHLLWLAKARELWSEMTA